MFKKFLSSPLSNTSTCYRYNGVHQTVNESIADHTMNMMIMARLIANDIQSRFSDKNIDIGRLLTQILFHDADEVITSDIPRPTKYHNQQVKESLELVAVSALDSIQQGLKCFKYDTMIHESWTLAKDETLEGSICKLVDFLQVVQKCYQENIIFNNHSFDSVIENLDESRILNCGFDKDVFDVSIFPIYTDTQELISTLKSRVSSYKLGN